jgi:hypothetical protein
MLDEVYAGNPYLNLVIKHNKTEWLLLDGKPLFVRSNNINFIENYKQKYSTLILLVSLAAQSRNRKK